MRMRLRVAAVAAVASGWAISQADPSFYNPYDPSGASVYGLSAITTPVAGTWDLGADYQVTFSTGGSDPDLYLNNIVYGGNTGSLNLASGSLAYRDNNNPDTTPGDPAFPLNYTFGTAIGANQNWTFDQVAALNDPTGATPGTYDFTMSFMGGANANANDLLATLNCELVVIPTIDITVTGQANPATIHAGDQTDLSMTVTDNMTDRNFVSTTWYVSGMNNGTGGHLNFSGFDWNTTTWFDQTIAPGASLTQGHSFWSADTTTPYGTYIPSNGVVGGLFNGDFHFFAMDPTSGTVQVVPEPMSMSALAIGFFALVLRRRRRS